LLSADILALLLHLGFANPLLWNVGGSLATSSTFNTEPPTYLP
jgi:hypothetical protein